MAPSAYIEARQNEQGDQTTRVPVDGEPYMPFLAVDSSDLESVKRAVSLMLNLDNTQDMKVTTVSGGITNALFCVSFAKDEKPTSVLVRVFGAEGMIDRDIENATFAALHKAGIAPGYLGRFGNGRLEQYLENGFRPLEVKELSQPKVSKEIAVQMALLHAKFKIPDHLKAYYDVSKPSVWDQLSSWMDQALNATFQTKNDETRAEALNLLQVKKEVQWLRDKVAPRSAAVAFCHNDLLAANIMWNGEEIHLIDFEYGGVNYCSFDIANHFNEYAGGTDNGVPNYELFPTEAQQMDFVKTYVETVQKHSSEGAANDSVEQVFEHVQAFVMVNHLYWGLWGVNQAATEGCKDFYYMLYATNRISQYFKCRERWNNGH